MNVGSAVGSISRWSWGVALILLLASPVQAFEAFDGRLQAHGFYESQFRTMNADYSEEWDVTQWYNVFNLELELDLVQDTIGVLDLMSAYVRAEVRYDCIYSSGCGMFRGINTYGDRSKSLPRRLSNGTTVTASGEIPIYPDGRASGSTTDPVPLSEVVGFSGVSDTPGQFITGSVVPCVPTNPNQNRPGFNCWPRGDDGVKPFDYVFENFSDFRFTMVNVKGGSGSGDPTAVLGPWLPKNGVSTIGTLSDRVNPFDSSRLNPVLNCRVTGGANADCFSGRSPGNGARPFRPIPVYAEDFTKAGPQKVQVVVYDDATNPALSNPNDPSTYRVIEIDTAHNHGDERFTGGAREKYVTVNVRFPGDDPNAPPPARTAYDARDLRRAQTGAPLPNLNYAVFKTSDRLLQENPAAAQPPTNPVIPGQSITTRTEFVNGQVVESSAASQARGLFVPSKPLRELMQGGDLRPAWPLNLSENQRAWNRGLAQQDEKELKEAYLDIEMFDSQLWLRIGKQQIVWGKTELFRTTDQFNPQDLALATLPSLEESRIALWSVRGVWSFYEVGPFEDVRLELAANIDDYESSDFGSCGEPYVVNVVCSAQFGAFAHGFTGVGIIGIEKTPEPWQSLKGWEIGGRVEWRWDRFSFALSDFWGYADLPAVRRQSTYERNVDPQTGRPLVYMGGITPDDRRINHSVSYASDVSNLWSGLGNGNDPWQDPYSDLRDLIAAQQANPGGVNAGTLPFARDPDSYVARGTASDTSGVSRTNCGTTKANNGTTNNNIRFNQPGVANVQGTLDGGSDCLTAGPTQLFDYIDPNGRPRTADGDLATGFDPNDPNCTPVDTNGDGVLEVPSTCSYQPTNSLDSHHANLTIFTWLCSATVGFLTLDETACAQTVFGSTEEASSGIVVAEVIGRLLGGDATLNALLIIDSDQTCTLPQNTQPFCDGPNDKGSAFLPFALPIVQLSNDPGDFEDFRGDPSNPQGCIDFQYTDLPPSQQVPCGGSQTPITFLGATLSPEQEALLGCGPFWGTQCDQSGIDLLNMEPSIVLQAFAGASGTLAAIDLKRQGISPAGTAIIDPTTGLVAPFKDPNEYRTDEGLQPGTLPWEALGIGGPLCSTADIGGDLYPRGQDKIDVPGGGQAARPASRKQALPGCHRKWIDQQNGYINRSWGAPVYMADGNGNLVADPVSGLPLQQRGASQCSASGQTCIDVEIDYFFYSGNPDPLGVLRTLPDGDLSFPDSVFYQDYSTPGSQNPLFSANRPAVGPGQPFAGRRAVAAGAGGPGNPELIVPFASELAGLSWNFQMIGVAFSGEFADALETVGDLADPDRAGCDPNGVESARRRCGARLEGGSIATGAFNNPQRVGANRRYVAQMLYGYCGSDYGVIDPTTGRGTCRIDDQVNPIAQLQLLYLASGVNPNDPIATQEFLDTLQFPDVALVASEDPTADPDQYNGIGPLFEGDLPATGEHNIIRNQHCSFITPQYCSTVRNLFFLAGLKRNTLAAGGNGAYGRRTMQWHAGGEITLYVPKRNVLGFAMDFAEDRSKANFSVETTWIENVPTGDADRWDNSKRTDEFNLTVSVDRPTFINFINPNRTLFINSQWFFQYRRGVKKGFGGNGPFNALATLTVFTGYFQDRLNPSITFVHDIQSASGGVLPSISYRFTENFQATVGMAMFYGRVQRADIPTNGIGPPSNEQGDWAYQGGAENGLSIVRDRDEVYLRLRYTF